MNLTALIRAYQTDEDSPYYGSRLRLCTRNTYDSLCKRVEQDMGSLELHEIKARELLHWHAKFLEAGTVAMGHSVIGMLRILTGFGATILEDAECVRISTVLGNMRFKMPPARKESLTADQAIRVRAEAHRLGRRSIALMQAFQFDLMLRQKDLLGEYVPLSEPGVSDVIDGDLKWLRGLRWEEIDADFILTHVTSKRQKEITVDLKLADMVIQELMLWFGAIDRARMPASGPVIVAETTGLPWRAIEFRRNWRKAANAAGVPKTTYNMDTRSGAITEALNAGAPIELVRKSATHSNSSMTSRYSRGDAEATAEVMKLRAASREG